MDVKQFLQESTGRLNKDHGIDITNTRGGFTRMLVDDNAFNAYVNVFNEGLTGVKSEQFKSTCQNMRVHLLESAITDAGLQRYETFNIPIFRRYLPNLIMGELVTQLTMDKPIITRSFFKGRFAKSGSTSYDYEFPVTTDIISRGPTDGIPVAATSSRGVNPGVRTNILTGLGFTTTQAHLSHVFVITRVTDSTGDHAVNIVPDIDGNFAVDLTSTLNKSELISGKVDFQNGILTWSSAENVVTSIGYKAIVSLEENMINPSMQLYTEKITFIAEDYRISTNYTVNAMQDFQALYDITLQSEAVAMIGDQITLDLNRLVIDDLIALNASFNGTDHTKTFDKNPASLAHFEGGRREWSEEIIPVMNDVSAIVYNATNMGSANVLAANPVDAAILENIRVYRYTGSSEASGDFGYRVGDIQGKWKILVSSMVPAGKMVGLYKDAELARSVYVVSTYVPPMLMPYPLGANPSLTVMGRFAKTCIRPEGLCQVNIIDTTA